MRRILIFLFFFPLFTSAQEVDTVFYTFPDRQPDTLRNRLELVNKIFLSDSIHILVNKSGCFSSGTYEYFIVKKKDSYAVVYINMGGGKSRLFNLDIKKFKELRSLFMCGIPLELGGCTTNVLFELSDKESSTYFIDNHCSEKDTYEYWLKRILH